FLKQSAAAVAGAVGFPYIIPASALGADGHTAPSDRLTLGLVGMGKMMGGHHGAFLSNPNVQVVALCDVESVRLGIQQQRANEAYSARFGADYKGVDTYKDFRELCARPDIDAVVNATPNHWHALIAIEAMRN